MSKFNPQGVATKDLLTLYNDAATELGRPQVNKFADRATAEKRTIAIREDLAKARAERASSAVVLAGPEGETVGEMANRLTGAASSPLGGDIAAVHQGEANHFVLNDAGQKAVERARAEAAAGSPEAARVAGKEVLHAQRQQAAADAIAAHPAASQPTPAPSGKREQWRRPKSEPAGGRAYMPRPGSKQEVMYELLKAGVTPEAFCERMDAIKSLNWKPSTVWGSVSFLFVVQKGYGLTFDGTTLQLVVPADERPAPSKKGG